MKNMLPYTQLVAMLIIHYYQFILYFNFQFKNNEKIKIPGQLKQT